ncbi:MAG: hypothetical protein KF777_08590 [Planctomycetaceae bacterium]|nr:hypothetical protein [Planctomycetaceae bacterium]
MTTTSANLPARLLLVMCCVLAGRGLCEAQFTRVSDWDGYTDRQVYGVPLDPDAVIEIADEPKVIDLGTLLPPEMSTNVTLAFDKTPLDRAIATIKEKLAIDVVFEESALNDEGIAPDNRISASANDEPLYLLLDRMLAPLQLTWDMRGGVLWITTETAYYERPYFEGHDLSRLLNQGYDFRQLSRVLSTILQAEWSIVGETLFVRGVNGEQTEIAALLVALQTPARQTFTREPAQTSKLRELLMHPVSVDFQKIPLDEALRILSQEVGTHIFINDVALHDEGLSEDVPISVSLTQKPLKTVLNVLLEPQQMTSVIRHGAITVTTMTMESDLFKIAVYDVRDFCRDSLACRRFVDTLAETTSGQWPPVEAHSGEALFARPGILVVRQTEPVHDEILTLIERHRAIRRQAEPAGDRPWTKSPELRFYRMPASVADYLEQNLPTLVAPETWRSDNHPDAPGTIVRIQSEPVMTATPTATKGTSNNEDCADEEKPAWTARETVVLAIQQSPAVHDEIATLRWRAEQGDTIPQNFNRPGDGLFSVSESYP